jgi:hypothetical protein
MMVMTTAMTPSLKASSLSLPIASAISAPGAATDAGYRQSLYKAGFIADAVQDDIKIEEALALVARAYAVRTGARVTVSGGGARPSAAEGGNARNYAPGLGDAPEPVRSYAQFAVDNGIASYVISSPSVAFPAGRPATRAETAAFIYAALELLGEV